MAAHILPAVCSPISNTSQMSALTLPLIPPPSPPSCLQPTTLPLSDVSTTSPSWTSDERLQFGLDFIVGEEGLVPGVSHR